MFKPYRCGSVSLISAYGTRLASLGEAALRLQGLCCVHKASPRRQCQCPADADASHPEGRDLIDGQADVPNHEQVERLACNRLDERLDLYRVLRAWGEEHVGAGCGVRLKTSNALA